MILISGVQSNWFRKNHLDLFCTYLKEKFSLEVKVRILARKKYNFIFNNKEFSLEKCFIFENTSNNLKFILDPHDHESHVFQMDEILKHDPSVVHIFKSQFDPMLIKPSSNLTPSLYYPDSLTEYINLRKTIRWDYNKANIKGLFFSGKTWRGRKKILQKINSILSTSERLPFPLFLKKMIDHRIILSLPGKGNLCHREFEAFGLGIPVLMLRHKNILIDPLIPNYHYIAVNSEENIYKDYIEAVNNKDLLLNISKNSLKWFERNCIYPNCYQHFDIGIKKIL